MPSKRLLSIIPLIFWLLIIIIKLIRIIPFYEGEALKNSLVAVAITTPLDIISFSYFYFLIVPSFVQQKKILLFSFLTILFFACYGIFYSWVYYFTGQIDSYKQAIIIYKSSLGHTVLAALYAVVLGLSVDWFRKYQKEKELINANMITELALLRSQINPHFLFNTLNNINSFSTHDPEKTSYAIIKLSDIMRYMLYDAANESVLLDKEIDYISNFIALHKLRYKENDFVRFTVNGESGGIMIPPMIFLPFIENAFKHGTNTVSNGIEIKIKIESKQIDFYCRNRVKELNVTEKKLESGIGIANIKRRLELLFNQRHQLSIAEEKKEFIVNLTILLNEH